MRELAWNCDSSLLLLWGLREDCGVEVLQLYTSSNYHWYLKQELELWGAVVRVTWHQEQPGELSWLEIQQGGGLALHSLSLSWGIDRSQGAGKEDLATVAVVDGNTVKVTPFR